MGRTGRTGKTGMMGRTDKTNATVRILFNAIATNDKSTVTLIITNNNSILFETFNNKIPLEFALQYIIDPSIESHVELIIAIMSMMHKWFRKQSKPYFDTALHICCINDKLLNTCKKYCDFNVVQEGKTIIDINLEHLYGTIVKNTSVNNGIIKSAIKTCLQRCRIIIQHSNATLLNVDKSPLITISHIAGAMYENKIFDVHVHECIEHLYDDFINLGSDINHIQSDDMTPLMMAIQYRQYRHVKLLIRYKVDINYAGATGTHHCLKLALQRYANAIEHYNITSSFLNADNVVRSSKCIKLLVVCKANVDYVDENLAIAIQQLLQIRYHLYSTIGNEKIKKDFDEVEEQILGKTTLINNKTIHKHNVLWYLLKCNRLSTYLTLLRKITLRQPMVVTRDLVRCTKDDDQSSSLRKLLKSNGIQFILDDEKPSMIINSYPYVSHSIFNSSLQSQTLFHALMLHQYSALWYFNIIDGATTELGLAEPIFAIYKKQHPTYSNNIIIWVNKSSYIMPQHFNYSIQEFLDSDAQYFILFVAIVGPTINHANVVIYDKIKNELERYDPYGDVRKTKHNQPYLDDLLRDTFTPLFPAGFQYKIPYGIMGTIGLQTLAHERNRHHYKHGDPKGYCLAWCFWFVEMRIQHTLSSGELLNALLSTIDVSLMEYIRNYANDLQTRQLNMLIENGIDANHIHDTVFTRHACKIIRNIYNKYFD